MKLLLPLLLLGQVDYPPGVTQDQLSYVVASTPQFINAGAFQSRDSLLSNNPCSVSLLGRLAHVNDLFGTVSSTLVCENDAILGYYWRPQRTDYSTVITQTSGTVSLQPLVTAPTVYLSNAPTASMSITPSIVNVWPGATFHIYAPAVISLGTISINGLVGGGTVTLLQGSDKILTYTSAGWKSN